MAHPKMLEVNAASRRVQLTDSCDALHAVGRRVCFKALFSEQILDSGNFGFVILISDSFSGVR
jgi:hypothetical protein